MGVQNNHDEIIIYNYNLSEELEAKTKLSVLINYNSDHLNAKQLWEKECKKHEIKSLGYKFLSDSSFSIRDNICYKSIYTGTLENRKVYYFSAIIIYKTQYYVLRCLCNKLEEATTFPEFILNNMEFFGEPKLLNDNKQKELFCKAFTSALTDTSEMKLLLISCDLLTSKMSANEKAKMSKDDYHFFENLVSGWNQSAYDFASNFKSTEKLKIIDKTFKVDNSQPGIISYMGRIILQNQAMEKFKIKILGMGIDGKIYLGKVVPIQIAK